MKFQEILEAPLNVDADTMAIFHNAYQECQPFLQQINNQPYKHMILRGMKDLSYPGHGLPDDAGIKTTRLDDRVPNDTPEEIHNLANEYFTQKHGHPYRNGLFVTGYEMTAEAYGKPYAVFPIGKFDFIWNENISDFTTDVADYVMQDIEEFAERGDGFWPEDLGKSMRMFGPYTENNGMIKAIENGGEIMIWCQEYYYMTMDIARKFEQFVSK